ncbi:MAG: hypothetical protein R2818_09580 [Flavobacteriales bacterium]
MTLTQQVPAGGDFATVTASAPTTTCAGTPLTLTATLGTAYAWSNGATTRTITPTASGSYSCTVTGTCGTDASDPVTVTFLSAAEPVGTGATIPGPGQATLSASGSDVRWYDAEFNGTELGAGSQFTTPTISSTTTYWAEARTTQAGQSANVGKVDNSGGGAYNTLDQYLSFDALQPFVLNSVKVYANSAGNRTFQVLTNGGSLVAEATVNVPAGQSRVTLNLSVPQGSGYRMKVTTAYIDMYRNSGGVSYPYSIGGLVNITGSSAGGQYYYYCYDWNVSTPPLVCTSARVPVVANVASGVVLSMKAFLDGPYDSGSGLMIDSLRRAGLIPLNEPYAALGFAQTGGGGEVMPAGMLSTTGNTAVVDWVLVELRNPTTPSTIVATQSALTSWMGRSFLRRVQRLPGVPDGNYHVALRHRNHLGVMTATPVALSGSSFTLDLTLPTTATWGTEARKTNGSVRTLWSGETMRDASIRYTGAGNDRDPVLQATVGLWPRTPSPVTSVRTSIWMAS